MNLFCQFVLSVFLFQDREALEREFNRILITLNSQTEYIDRWVDFFLHAHGKPYKYVYNT